MKLCNLCKIAKPESEFSPGKGYRDGLNARCKECRRKTCLGWYYTHHFIVAERIKQRYYNNVQASRKKGRENAKHQRRLDPEKFRKRCRDWYKQHADEFRKRAKEYARLYRAEGRVDKQKAGESRRRYMEKYPERIKEHRNNMRFRRLNVPGEVTAKQWKQIILFYGRACGMCHVPDSEFPLTVDHFIPISKGGTNNWWNVWPLCLTCNLRKNNKLPTESHPPHVAVLERTADWKVA